MLGLENQEITRARTLLLELAGDASPGQTADLCPDGIKARATRVARNLEVSLSLLPGFRKACDAAGSFIPSATRPVYSSQFQTSKNETLSLLGIHPESRIPVHDHPDMLGLLYVIKGRIHVPGYDINGGHEGSAFVELTRRSGEVLQSGDAVLTLPHTGNLHGLQAVEKNAVCLTLHLHLRQDRQPRSWYFPLVPKHCGNSGALWYRKEDKEICDGI
jgi:hypothetical protein